MVAKVETEKTKLDMFIWSFVVTLLLLAVGGNFYFSGNSLLARTIGVTFLAIVAFALALRTTAGKLAKSYWDEALFELRKMVWPTRQETMQSTIAVLAMVVVMGLLLWAVDAGLIRVMSWLIGHGE